MVLRRIEPVSCAKVYGLLCVFIGFIIGLIFAVVAWMTSQVFGTANGAGGGLGFLFGGASIILFPIFYGIFGFIMGYLSAVIYNWIAGMVGGIELEFE